MKLAVVLVVALAGCNACQPAAAPVVTDQVVYSALVDGGCLVASDGGLAAVAAEHAGPNPAYLNCLYSGGTVAGCNVPCAH